MIDIVTIDTAGLDLQTKRLETLIDLRKEKYEKMLENNEERTFLEQREISHQFLMDFRKCTKEALYLDLNDTVQSLLGEQMGDHIHDKILREGYDLIHYYVKQEYLPEGFENKEMKFYTSSDNSIVVDFHEDIIDWLNEYETR